MPWFESHAIITTNPPSGIIAIFIVATKPIRQERKVTTDPAVEAMKSFGADEKMIIWVAMVWGLFGFSEPKSLAEIKDHIIHFHGKFYSLVNGDEPDLRYEEVVKTLLEINYTGWMPSEFEGGEADSFEIVKAHQIMVRGYIQ